LLIQRSKVQWWRWCFTTIWLWMWWVINNWEVYWMAHYTFSCQSVAHFQVLSVS
jgi:hypothetical protein